MPRILLVDSDRDLVDRCATILRGAGHDIAVATSGAEAIAQAADADVVLLAGALPDGDGLATLRHLLDDDPKRAVVMLTASGGSAEAIEAIQAGAFDYLVKPVDLRSIEGVVDRAVRARRTMEMPVELGADGEPASPDALVGRGPAIQRVYKSIGRLAAQDVTVLIRGETGTGKELVARAIYAHSRRRDRPFLAINCTAIPDALLESELFGHEKGAFTGADRRRIGKFEQYDGGTLFLDEIGDMPASLQSKMLRLLQDQSFQRVGGSETIRTDVRIVAATNCDLEDAMDRRLFRRDLFYRLAGFTIALPPLRDRLEDVRELVDHFLARDRGRFGKALRTVSDDALARMCEYGWPGNVRELENVVRFALVNGAGEVLMPEHLPDGIHRHTPVDDEEESDSPIADFIDARLHAGTTTLHEEAIERVERVLLERVLAWTRGNQVRAASILGLARNTLRAKLRRYRLAPPAATPDADGEDVDHGDA